MDMTIETTLRGAARTAYIAAHEKAITYHAIYTATFARFESAKASYREAKDGSRGIAAKTIQEAFTALCEAEKWLCEVPSHHRPAYEPRQVWLTLYPDGRASNGPHTNDLDQHTWTDWLSSRGIPLPPKGTGITAEYLIEIGV
jgi:hypothetical protein